MWTATRRLAAVCAAALALQATPARAQGFISPILGFDFGGDATCPAIRDCTNKTLNVGVALGSMNAVLGFEGEFAYARNFFGEAPGLSSSVVSAMGNVLLAPHIGPMRPYALTGLGLMKTHVDLSPSSLLSTDHNSLAWDAGGGLMVDIAPHVAVRGDIRYFHAFSDLTVGPLALQNVKLDFGRAAGGLVFSF
jgi:opacity protein-like surface antigen